MPLARTQSVLKKLLPKQCFRLLYHFGLRGCVLWHKILVEETHYLLPYSYYLLIGNSRNIKRLRTIYLIKSYSLVGRSGLLATYDIAHKMERNNIDGCFVERGVARGAFTAYIA